MFPKSLWKCYCKDSLPVKIDACCGYGADGEIFSIVGEPNKVIKVSVLFDNINNSDMIIRYKQIEDIFECVITTKPCVYVNVYEYGYLGAYSRGVPSWDGEQKFIIHYHIMEKLRKISEDESKLFHSIISHEDSGIIKDFSLRKIRKILKGLTLGLDFDAEKVILFCDNIMSSTIKHNDIHPRNIMIDVDGNFKLIDLDRCKLYNIRRP